MKYAFLAIAAAAVFIATPAVAQDEETAGNRLVIGSILGVDSLNVGVGEPTAATEDFLPGITVGYEFETEGGVVFGLEAEYTHSNVNLTLANAFAGGDRLSLNAGRDFYAGGRLGFRPGRNGLLFVKGGYSNARIGAFYRDATTELSDQFAFEGIRVGVGGEIDLGGTSAIRLEFRHTDYGALSLFGQNTGLELNRNQGIVTLLRRF